MRYVLHREPKSSNQDVGHASNLERKESGKARQLDLFDWLFWDVDLNSGDDERAGILCPAAHLEACKKK